MAINNRHELHKEYFDDVVYEISLDSMWRRKLFEGKYDKRFLLSYKNMQDVPQYLKEVIEDHKLEYYISKTRECPEEYEEGLVVFKFEAKEFPDLVGYSGNNEKVV